MGIAYDYAERIKEESIGDASKVATEAYLTLGYRKLPPLQKALPQRWETHLLGIPASPASAGLLLSPARWRAGRGDRPATSGDGRALPRTWDSIGVDP